MRLHLLETLGIFAERKPFPIPRLLSISLPDGCELILNGTHRYQSANGAVHIPASHIREGSNHLSLKKEERLFQTEGLWRENESVRPLALPAETLLYALFSAQKNHEKRLLAIEETLHQNEIEKSKRTLFS